LTDEISYVLRQGDQYVAFGTPFTGELAKLGENVSASISALYLLAKGNGNRVDPVSPDVEVSYRFGSRAAVIYGCFSNFS
jgi:hypothetical protein